LAGSYSQQDDEQAKIELNQPRETSTERGRRSECSLCAKFGLQQQPVGRRSSTRAVRHQTRCFVFTSSIAVYGALKTPITEEMTPRPEDFCGIAKNSR
jgi:hypothetical protein